MPLELYIQMNNKLIVSNKQNSCSPIYIGTHYSSVRACKCLREEEETTSRS